MNARAHYTTDRADMHQRRAIYPRPTGTMQHGDSDMKEDEHNGDRFSPLNDHSRLLRRNHEINYYKDRYELIYRAQLEKTMGPVKSDNDVHDAHAKIKYKPLRYGKWLARVLFNICSLGGMIPTIWDTISSATFTASFSVLLSLLMQSQNEATNLVNGQESWLDAQKYVINFVQIGLVVLGVLTAVQIINYSTYAWKSHVRILKEARFEYIYNQYKTANPKIPNYVLEYNPDCDPDIAMMYFTNREEKCNKGGWLQTALQRWHQVLRLPVDDAIANMPKNLYLESKR